MRTILTWIGRLLAALVVIVLIAVAVIYVRSEQLVNQTFQAPQVSIKLPSDAASIERGHHIATVIADCTGCHGANFAGTTMLDDPAIGFLESADLTTGK